MDVTGLRDLCAEHRRKKKPTSCGLQKWTLECHDLLLVAMLRGELKPGDIVPVTAVLETLRRNGLNVPKGANAIGTVLGKHGLGLMKCNQGYVLPTRLPVVENGTVTTPAEYDLAQEPLGNVISEFGSGSGT